MDWHVPFCTLLHLSHRPNGMRSAVLTFTLAHGGWKWADCRRQCQEGRKQVALDSVPQGHTLKPLHTKGKTKRSQHSSLCDAFFPKVQHKFSSKEKIYEWVGNKLETRERTQEYFPEKISCITTLKWKLSYFWRLASLKIHTSIFIDHAIFILSK